MRARALTTDELQRIRDHLQDASARDRALFELGVNAGLRISETCALDVGQVYAYSRIVENLELTETKGQKHRRVPMNAHVRDVLANLIEWKRANGERLRADAPLLCNYAGDRLSRQGADKTLRRLFADCELSGKVTTHSLRRTFATTLSSKGVPLRSIQELLGHANLTTTQAYLSVTEDDLRRAVDVVAPA